MKNISGEVLSEISNGSTVAFIGKEDKEEAKCTLASILHRSCVEEPVYVVESLSDFQEWQNSSGQLCFLPQELSFLAKRFPVWAHVDGDGIKAICHSKFGDVTRTPLTVTEMRYNYHSPHVVPIGI